MFMLALALSSFGDSPDETAAPEATVTATATATVTTTVTASPTPSPTPTETKTDDSYEEYRDEDGFVSRADYGRDWPLKVEAGFLDCPKSFGDRAGAVVFRTLNGDEYALNGQAAHDYPEIRPIWRNDPSLGKNSGIKMSTVSLLIDDALDLC